MAQVDRTDGLTGMKGVKDPVKAVAITSIALAGEQTVGGVAVVTGDRVLVTAQASSIDNGIYNVATSTWTRAKDFNGTKDIATGTLVVGPGGTIYAVTTAGAIGTGAIEFTIQAAGSGGGPWAPQAGDVAQVFAVSAGVGANDAVNVTQLATKADLGGSAAQVFAVSAGVGANDAVNVTQMATKADLGGSAAQVFDVANGVAGTDAINFSQALGLGQTWQNLTLSRAFATNYTNSTGKPIVVSILCSTAASGATYSVTVDGVIMAYQQAGSNLNSIGICGVVVPPGGVYSATNAGNCTITLWAELR